MKQASNEQAFEVGKLIVSRVNWKKVDGDKLQQEVIEQPDRFARELEIFLANGGRSTVEVVVTAFPVWREITVGPIEAESFCAEMYKAGIEVDSHARGIMIHSWFHTLEKPQKLRLARATVRDLGFTEGPTFYELWARIEAVGGTLCPHEVGPQLRKDFVDQPIHGNLMVAMKRRVFSLERYGNGKLALGARGAEDYYVVSPNAEFVFVLGKPIQP